MSEVRRQTEQTAANDRATDMPASADRCPHCGVVSETVWVHGHGQCKNCGVNRAPCCDGGGCH